DPSVDPCTDFYNYACGSWKHHHVLPPDRPHSDTFAVMKDELKVLLKAVIEARREKPLLKLLDSLGSWPVITPNWTGDDFDWLNLTAVMRRHSNDILFGQWVGADSKNSTVNVIHLLGAERSFASQEMEDVLNLEARLINLTVPNELRRNFTAMYNKWTVEELQERIPLINWTLYFNTVMPMKIPPTEEIVLFAPTYIKQMSELLQTIPKRVIANYILWRFVSNRVGSLDKRFLDKQQEYFGAIYGTQTTPARWKTCTLLVNKNMGMAVGALFVRRHFNEQSKKKARATALHSPPELTAEEMISDIKAAFLEILNNVDWMDSETRHVAREKAMLMTEKIGFPEYISDATELDKEYEVEFKRDTYFENIIKNLKHSALRMAMKLRTGVDRT
ncbi:hypothetical protein HPB47_012129, partial [Ixodes persulcatus]